MKRIIKHIFICFFLFSLSCKEEFIIETQDFESVLVVEATITNELKYQEVKLSRTFLLEQNEQIIENNADIKVVDDTGNSYNFSQDDNGTYISEIEFEAVENKEYTLIINTSNGKTYNSTVQTLTSISQIDNLYAEFVNDDVNGPGVQVFVDSNNSNSDAKYFRYEYEETYQIIAPYYFALQAVFSNYVYFPETGSASFDVDIIARTQEEETCYKTYRSQNILLATTNNLNENIVQRFPIRFIREHPGAEQIGVIIDEFKRINDVSILRDRYSIIVSQYVQNIASHTYYEKINTLGNNEDILFENQPGYINGNIKGADENEKIVGFFSVSSVSKKRIFFNYVDVNIPKPEYIYQCDVRNLDFDTYKNDIYRLINSFQDYNMNYQITDYPGQSWMIANPECTDCTAVGSNIQPDFWID
ncbi:DUF4249 domain-containing protein [Lacinutrix sp. Hel_I_90]|uniref:DUF4249 domain-containing protein n=1 Tax=Lacinutrix sp. Hel_I_90 TaxID=1249999 RepID=UPI0005C92000|nr:DUF4249 domain-containing protein [Lacinutrix sp. Hel_I_90]